MNEGARTKTITPSNIMLSFVVGGLIGSFPSGIVK
jgi:hypothetical protein